MKNFRLLQEKNPNLAETLKSLSKDELLENYATEVFEKEELEDFKNTYDDATTDLECIVNFGIHWLKENRKDGKHHLYITNETAKLIYTNTETEFI